MIIMRKTCIKCGENKELDEFTKCKTSKNGYRGSCKICTNANKNYAKYKPYQKKYRLENLENKKTYMVSYNAKPEVKKKIKNWNRLNKDRINELKRYNRKNNIPHIISWRNLLTRTLVAFNQKKNDRRINLLGYTPLDLRVHIESLFTEGMSWENHGEWHIDHIKPVSLFSPNTHPSIVNELSNLQPLWATTREINGVVYEGNLNKKIKK